MTLASDLVQFLMHLFGNRQAAQDFLDNPERVLDEHGLGGVSSADVDAAMPVVLDYAPVTINASRFDRDYTTGGNRADTGHNAGGHLPPPSGGGHGGADHDHDDHAHAIQQLHHVVNNYSYTSTVDDRDTITDQSVNQNIWADGDVEQWFDNDSVVASGDRAIAAGDDADVDDSNNIEDSFTTDNSTDESMDNSIRAGGDVNVGNEETDVDDSFNTDLEVDVDDSFNDSSDNSDHSDNSENTDNSTNDYSYNDDSTHVIVDESFNDNSVNTDNSVNDYSYNDYSSHTNVDAGIHDTPDNSTTTEPALEDSLQDNPVTPDTPVNFATTEGGGDVADSFPDSSTAIEDSVEVAGTPLEFTEDNPTTTDVEIDNEPAVEDSHVDDTAVL